MLCHSLSFQGAQSLATVEEARRRLLAALAAADRLEIDLAEVGEVDLAFLQLIVATGISARARGKTVFWRAAGNATVAVAMRRAGLVFDLDGPGGRR